MDKEKGKRLLFPVGPEQRYPFTPTRKGSALRGALPAPFESNS